MPEATRPFQRLQYGFAASIRDPENQPRPQGVPAPRMQVYQELIYNNLELFLATGFPVLKATAGDAMWRALIRDFLRCHQSKTPYLAELGEEFLTYLQNERTQIESDPAFLLELAHYEWVELALLIAEAVLPAEDAPVIGRSAVSDNLSLGACVAAGLPVSRTSYRAISGPTVRP